MDQRAGVGEKGVFLIFRWGLSIRVHPQLTDQESLANLLQEGLVDFDGSKVTEQEMQHIRDKLSDDLKDYSRSSALARHRTVSIEFMGAPVEVQLSGAAFELELRMLARIKNNALMTSSAGLRRLLYETWMLEELGDHDFTCPATVLEPMQRARNYAGEIIDNHDLACVNDIQYL